MEPVVVNFDSVLIRLLKISDQRQERTELHCEHSCNVVSKLRLSYKNIIVKFTD